MSNDELLALAEKTRDALSEYQMALQLEKYAQRELQSAYERSANALRKYEENFALLAEATSVKEIHSGTVFAVAGGDQ